MWKNWNPFRKKQKEVTGENKFNRNEKNLDSGHGQVGKENSILSSSRLDNIDNHNGNDSYEASDASTYENDNRRNGSQSTQRKHFVSRHQSLRSRTAMGLRDQLNVSMPASHSRPITRRLDDHDVQENPANKTFSGVHGPLLSSPIVPQVRKALESQAGISSHGILSSRGKLVGRSASLSYGSSRHPTRSTAGQVPWVRLKRRESLGLSDLVTGNTPQSPNTVKLAAPEPRHLPAPPSFKTTLVIVTTEASRNRVIDTQTVVSALREKRKRFGSSQQEESIGEDSWQSSKRRRQDSSQSNASSVSIPPMPDTLPDLMGTPGTSLLHIENLSSQRPSTVPATVDPYISSTAASSKAAGSPHIVGLGGLSGSQIMGLGGGVDGIAAGNMSLPPQQLPFYRYPTFPPQQQQPHQVHLQHSQQPSLQQRKAQYMAGGGASGNMNNSKSVLRSIQSSLSSSMRARVNSAALQQPSHGLKRIRGRAQENSRRLSFSSDVSMGAKSADEPVNKSSKASTSPSPGAATTQVQTSQRISPEKTSDQLNAARQEATVSTPTKRKIAEGVMLRKQNMSISGTASPARPLRALPASALVSADDFESDRQQEYRQRVLDLLGEEEDDTPPTGRASVTTTSTTTAPAVTPAFSIASLAPPAAAAAPTNTINASLASLSKLVQATTPLAAASGVPPTLSTATTAPGATASDPPKGANSLKQLLRAEDDGEARAGSTDGVTLTGKPLASPVADQSQSAAPVTQASTTSEVATPSAPPATTAASLSQPPLSSVGSGFQVNFSAAIPAACVLPAAPSGFSFGGTAAAPTTSALASGGTSSSSTAVGDVAAVASAAPTSTGIPQTNLSTAALPAQQTPATIETATSKGFNFNFGSAAGAASISFGSSTATASSAAGAQVSSQGFNFTPASTTPSTGGFTFGATSVSTPAALSAQKASVASGLNFGLAATGASAAGTATTTTTAGVSSSGLPSGFTFGSAPSSSTQQASGAGGVFSGVKPAAMVPASFGGFGGAVTTHAPATSAVSSAALGFGGFTATSPSAAVAAAATATTVAALQQPTNPLVSTFGNTSSVAETALNPPKSVAVPAFNFSGTSNAAGQNASKPFTFGASAAATVGNTATQAAAAPTLFGANSAAATGFGVAATAPAAVSSIFGANAVTATGFGAAATVSATSAPSGFGTNVATATRFGAGATGAILGTPSGFGANVAAATGFGAAATATTASAPSGFGANVAAATRFGAVATTASAPSGFGANVAAATGFGAAATATTGVAPFGVAPTGFGASLTTTVPTSVFGAAPLSVFGASTTSTTASGFGGGSFNFGNSQSSSASAGFGSTPSSAFGGTTVQTFGASAATGFGAPARPALFGGSGTTVSTASQPPAFGASTGAPSAFGSTATPNTQAPAVFAFGGAAQSQPTQQPFSFGFSAATSPNQQPSVFGSSTGAAAPSSSLFGQPSGQGSASNTIFGAGNSSMNPPAFGTPAVTPAFGAAANTNSASGSAFGAGLASPPAFGMAAQQAKPAPAFGATGFGNSILQNTAFSPQSTNQAQPQPVMGEARTFGGTGVFGNSAKPNAFGGGGGEASAPGTATGVFSFSGSQPQPQGVSTFGAQPSTAGTVPSAFNFGAQPAGGSLQSQGGGLNFGAAAQTPARPSGGFNFAAAAGSTPSFNFSAGSAPTANMFTPQPGSTPRPRAAAARRVAGRRAPRK